MRLGGRGEGGGKEGERGRGGEGEGERGEGEGEGGVKSASVYQTIYRTASSSPTNSTIVVRHLQRETHNSQWQ